MHACWCSSNQGNVGVLVTLIKGWLHGVMVSSCGAFEMRHAVSGNCLGKTFCEHACFVRR
jgi:hypothetical protein